MSSGNKILRIVGYGRESTREQAKYGFNLDDQEDIAEWQFRM